MGIHDSMTELNSARSKLLWSRILLILSIVGFFLASMFFRNLIVIVLFIALMFLGIKLDGDVGNKYKEIYKRLFVEEPLRKNFDRVYYNWKEGLTEPVVESFGLCNMGNRFRSEDHIIADYNGIHFEISDVYVAHHSSSGKSSHTTIYFKGRMMVFNFPDKMVDSVKIFSRNFKHRRNSWIGQKPNKVEMESAQFNKDFDVLCSNEHDAFYLITPQLIEKLEQLQSKYKSIAIHICGNNAFVGFNEPHNNAFDPKSNFKETSYPEEMEKVQADMDDIKDIITILRDPNTSNDYYKIV